MKASQDKESSLSASSANVHTLTTQSTLVRFPRQLHQMIVEEGRDEHCREAALLRAAGHPLRRSRLQLRHDRERKDKRALIGWIRKDIEVSRREKARHEQLLRTDRVSRPAPSVHQYVHNSRHRVGIAILSV